MVSYELFAHELSLEKWNNLLTSFVLQAVEEVKPSSQMLNDLMDINEFVKIKLINWPDASRSQYIHGVALNKALLHIRMKQKINNPRILLLRGSLGH